jgi:hypothetical protein
VKLKLYAQETLIVGEKAETLDICSCLEQEIDNYFDISLSDENKAIVSCDALIISHEIHWKENVLNLTIQHTDQNGDCIEKYLLYFEVNINAFRKKVTGSYIADSLGSSKYFEPIWQRIQLKITDPPLPTSTIEKIINIFPMEEFNYVENTCVIDNTTIENILNWFERELKKERNLPNPYFEIDLTELQMGAFSGEDWSKYTGYANTYFPEEYCGLRRDKNTITLQGQIITTNQDDAEYIDQAVDIHQFIFIECLQIKEFPNSVVKVMSQCAKDMWPGLIGSFIPFWNKFCAEFQARELQFSEFPTYTIEPAKYYSKGFEEVLLNGNDVNNKNSETSKLDIKIETQKWDKKLVDDLCIKWARRKKDFEPVPDMAEFLRDFASDPDGLYLTEVQFKKALRKRYKEGLIGKDESGDFVDKMVPRKN